MIYSVQNICKRLWDFGKCGQKIEQKFEQILKENWKVFMWLCYTDYCSPFLGICKKNQVLGYDSSNSGGRVKGKLVGFISE